MIASGELLDPQSEWARLLMSAFVDAGLCDVVNSPGSRSTPFVLAALDEPRLRLRTIIDERAAAFFALGQARAAGRPSLLLCTSGTAPAHYLPAILEARASGTPLLILSADRPLETQGAHAPQTCDQIKLYGDAVLRFFELGSVDATPSALRGLRRIAAQAAAQAARGPVHLNVRARKPLEPRPAGDEDRAASAAIRAARGHIAPRFYIGVDHPDAAGLRRLAAQIAETAEGVVVVGPRPGPGPGPGKMGELEAVCALARRAGYPVLREAASGTIGPAVAALPPGALALLGRGDLRRADMQPRLVIQVGAVPTAGAYERLAAEATALEILSDGLETDADSRAGAVHVGDVTAACTSLSQLLEARGLDRGDASWRRRWAQATQRAGARLGKTCDGELGMVRALLDHLDGSTLCCGNSLPIREVELACAAGATPPARVFHQRGTSGIDGLVAGAAGVASIIGPVVALIGDVSLLHDLHGLLAARDTPVVIAVLCNGGGRIFETLPIGRRAELHDALPHLTTPAATDLAALARFAGIEHARVDRAAALGPALEVARVRPGATLLELVVDPSSAATLDERLPALVNAALTEQAP
jgi:2-succinyl-5-enolpyruvyl-6-hydroxy-3-cyclohexene-1-carboxylate synthase